MEVHSISNATLEAVRIGILTDSQLNSAILHYTQLECLLACHGEIYHLVRIDVMRTLETLNGFRKSRLQTAIEKATK